MDASRQGGRGHRPRRTLLAITALGAVIGASSLAPSHPALIWNATESVPLGLYAVARNTPAKGDIVALAPTGALRRTLDRFDVLPAGRLLLKQIAAAQGDTICRNDTVVTINGLHAAVARSSARDGRKLPAWSGCRTLSEGEALLLAPHPASFDGRYFGPTETTQIVGIARPVLTLPLSQGTP